MKIAILGYGTVGSGVADIIELNNKTVSDNIGEDIEVKYILDIREFPGDKNEKKITNDYNRILEDPEVSVVCEVMGGVNPAYEFSKKALEAGKSVCTSNKELVANHGGELLELARKNKVNYLFEASCGGGIPVICTINSALTANNIDEITGILNGTTNYILTNMAEKGAEYAEVLKEAQDLGYAERNPEADVEGYDACRKIAILSSLAFNKKVSYEDIYTEGITKISKEDILYAKRMNMAIRLLATSRKAEDGRVFSMVSPFMVNSASPLYSVNGVFNAVFIHGDMLGDSMYYGSGAGKLPTASAVVGDVVLCARNKGKTVMTFNSNEKLTPADIAEDSRRFLIRIPKEELDEAVINFGNCEIIRIEELPGEVGIVTGVLTEKEFEERSKKIGTIINRIRIK